MHKKSSVILVIFLVNVLFIAYSLDIDFVSGAGSQIEGNWTWINGNDTLDQNGIYNNKQEEQIKLKSQKFISYTLL